MPSIADNTMRVREHIAEAAAHVGRDPREITLVAVTKTVGTDLMAEALSAGISDFGENYVQELRDKAKGFGPEVRWHFIGHVQTNKARYLAGQVGLIHSVDSVRLAEELSRRALALGTVQDVLLEVKLDPAATKFGIEPTATPQVAEEVSVLKGVWLRGLMGMAPVVSEPDDARPYFARLRKLFDRLPAEFREVLSMGMSADFEAAIQEGSTLVRVGTAIFGRRS